jgi:hypothetical protein
MYNGRNEIYGEVIEYKMSADMANLILKDNKKRINPQEFLCDYVNKEFGLKAHCIRVVY